MYRVRIELRETLAIGIVCNKDSGQEYIRHIPSDN